MKILTRTFYPALLLGLAMPVSAALIALEEAYELDTADVTLPGHRAGRVIMRACAGCDATVHRVAEATTYHIGADTSPVTLDELRAAVDADPGNLIYVYFKPETLVVTRIVLDANR